MDASAELGGVGEEEEDWTSASFEGHSSSRIMATNPPNTMVMSVPPGPAGFSTPSSPSSNSSSSPGSSYVVNSKIMVVAVAVLFAVVLFILCLHIYAKWFWRNQGSIAAAGPGTLSWRLRRRYRDDPNAQNFNQAFVNLQSVGLEKSVVEALPTFEYKPSEANSKLECVVCLEEFEDGEKGRTLPKCGHNFHLDCIDMWLHSHSTCPLCRASVQPPDADSMEKAGTPAPSSAAAASAVVIAITTDSPNSSPSETVVGDVQAPFMAAMRASRRRRGLGLGLPLSPAVTNSLPRTAEDHHDAQAAGTDSSMQGGEHQQQQSRNESSAMQTPSGADPKLNAAKTSSKIPSNVLFWGNQTQVNTSAGSINPSRSSSLRAPFQVAIDIPRASNGGAAAAAAASDSGSSSSFTNLMSPMMRASASFRRLLSQGRNAAVSPHTPSSPDDAAAAGSSSSLPPPPNA